MFFSDWRILLRRWYAVVIGLGLTVGLCFGVTQMVRPSYEIKAMMLVLPPKSTVGQGGNPFLSLGGLGSVADVVSRAMMDGNTVKSLVAMGADADFQVVQDATSAGPVILITSSGHSPAEAENTLRIIKSQIPVKLLALQEASQVPERSLIKVSLLSQDETPTVVRKSQIRAVFGSFAIGIASSLVLIGLLDGALLRRSRRRSDLEETDEQAVDVNPALAGYDRRNAGPPAAAANGVGVAPQIHRDLAQQQAQQQAQVTARAQPHFVTAHEAEPQPTEHVVPRLLPVRPIRRPEPYPESSAPPTGPLPIDHPARSYRLNSSGLASGSNEQHQPSGPAAKKSLTPEQPNRRPDRAPTDDSALSPAHFDKDRAPSVFRIPPSIPPSEPDETTERPPKRGTGR
jgi:hypothetical protein